MILDILMESKKRWLKEQKLKTPFHVIAPLAMEYASRHKALDFAAAVKKGRPGIVPVIIHAVPTGEVFREPFDVESVASDLQRAGADALSLFTEERYFKGDEQWISRIRPGIHLPLLHGDLIFSKWQICRSRLLGADAVCLIASTLDLFGLKNFIGAAERLGMQCMVVVTCETELIRALQAGASIIGVSNRSLSTYDVDMTVSERLRKLIPQGTVCLSVGGIADVQAVRRLHNLGFDGVMVGKELMAAYSPGEKLQELRG